MTETPSGSTDSPPPPPPPSGETPPPPPPPPPPQLGTPPLTRPVDDRVFRGVCAAIGRATGTDPVLWRVVVVVLAVFGGTGIVLYLAGWLLIPEEGSAESEGQRLLRGQGSSAATVGLVVLAVLAVLLVLGDGRGLVPLAVIGTIAYLVLRSRSESTAAQPWAASTAAPWTSSPPATGSAGGTAPWSAGSTAPWSGSGAPPPAWGPPPVTPAPARPPSPAPRSTLGLLTVSAVVMAVGGLLLAAQLGADGVTAPRVLAVALLLTGLGLVVGARWGRARGLIALAVVLALALGATSSFDNRFGTSVGDRTWVVQGSSTHELGAGTAVLDLSPLAEGSRRVQVEASVGTGELVVRVPEDLPVELEAQVGAGELLLVDPDGTRSTLSGFGRERATRLGPDDGAAVRVKVTVGVGALEVRRVAS